MSLQFFIAEMNKAEFFGIYRNLVEDEAAARLFGASNTKDDANTITKALIHCSSFAPSHEEDLRMELALIQESSEAEFIAAVDQGTCFRIYEAPDEMKESPRLVGIAWDEEDAEFITSSLNHCYNFTSSGYIFGPMGQPVAL